MKKILLIATILITILGSFQPAQAGWSTEKRNRCWPWSNKFVASAHLLWWKCGLGWDNNRNANCGGVSAYVGRYWGCCSKKSEAYAQSNGGGQWGWVSIQCSGVSGAPYSELLADATMSGDDPVVDGEYSVTQDCRLNAEFGPANIDLNDLNIKLNSVTGADQDNKVTVAVWQPMDDPAAPEEDTYDDSKALVYGTVSLKDGALAITGELFTAADFMVETTADGGITATYVGGPKSVPVPATVDITAVAVHAGGDVVKEGTETAKKLMEEQTGTAVLNLYPNPASKSLQLSLTGADEQNATVTVYDLSGKRVKEQQVAVTKGSNLVNVDVATLPAGNYYLMVKGTELRIVKQFTKQ